MLRTLPQAQDQRLVIRIAGIGIMLLVTVISARISIPIDPVPFTLQPLAMLLAGMILGSRDGMLSQLAYVTLIAVGLPVDANMRGQAALFGPTGGYLIGFVAAAFVSGWLVEKAGSRLLQRWLAGVVGILVLYALGLAVLMWVTRLDFASAWVAGAAPFFFADLIKAFIAAGVTEGGRALLLRK